MRNPRQWRRYEPVTPGWLTDYLRLSHMAYTEGLIGEETLIDRLARALEAEEEPNPLSFNEDADRFVKGKACKDTREFGAEIGSRPLPLMEFSLPPQSPQSGWVFSSRDTDPLPSIPHGHWKTHTNQRKFDPYLGYIYEGRKRTGERLSWKECNRFWRSKNFREFAKSTLEAAIADPRVNAEVHIKSRGVESPYRLPR